MPKSDALYFNAFIWNLSSILIAQIMTVQILDL